MGDWFTQNAPPTPEEAQMLAQIRARESSGDYSARNPKPGSTAAGAYQFTSSPVSPTWQMATKATGVPVYPSADKAPRAIQDANALYMLRKHGPDATITWAASGPYGQAGDGGNAAPSKDAISRILAGEDIELTPDVINEIVSGKLPGSSAETAPAAQPAPSPEPSGPVQSGDWFAKNAPPAKPATAPQDNQPGVVERFKKQYTQQTGINDLLDIIRASNRYGTPREVAARGEKAQTALGHLVTGLRDEPARVWSEISGIGQSMLDTKQNTADMSMHMLGAVPMFGPALQGFVHDVWAKKYPEAAADLAALGTLKYGPKALEAAEALPEAAQTARAAVSGAVKGGWEGGTGPTVLPIKIKGVQVAEIPGVPASIAGAVTGGGAGTLFGGPKLGIAGAVGGAAIPVVRGAVKGARAALADLEAARATGAAEAFPVPAEPAPGPIAGPTDEALVHLYSVETDPVKRSALQSQLIDRGLMNEPSAPVTPPEANPYRTYSQDALRKVYAIEPEAAKRALIEQAARDRNLTLLSREGRRATAAVPETGAPEARGPSLTQDEARMLRYLGEKDPLAADVETIALARKVIVDHPELMRRLRAGEPEPVVTAPTPADQAAIAQPAVQSVPAAMEYNAPAAAPQQQPAPAAPTAAPPAPAAPTAAPAAAQPTPGQAYAVSQGYDWAKLSANDRELFEHIATAQENVATTPALPPPTAPPPAATPPAQPRSLADLMRGAPETDLEKQLADSIAAAKAAKQPAPETPPEAPTQKPENIYAKNARLAKAVRVADAAQEAGLTSSAVYKMKPDDFAAKVGEKSISPDTMAMVIDKLRRREADAARGGAPPTTPTPSGGGPAPTPPKAAASFKVVKNPAEPGLWNVDVKTGNQSIGTMELIEHPNELEVDLSHLTPEYRGQGYGKAMYQEAMKHAQQLGKRYLTSGSEFTEDAARVWRSLGGEQFTDAAGESRWRLPVPK